MSKKRDQRNILIGVLLVAIVVMSVGYAAFATTLTVGGTSTITNNWNVAITDITVTDTQGNAKSTTATYTATTATFAVDLQSPGDRIEYTVTVRNGGTEELHLQFLRFLLLLYILFCHLVIVNLQQMLQLLLYK